MERRNFIKNSSLLAASIGVFGKIQWNGFNYEGNTPTTTDILGPFYRPGAPMRSNIIPPGSAGEILHLNGIVFKKDGTTPLKGALVEVWQVNEKAQYDNTSDEYLGRGAVETEKDGKYYFKTIMPVPYQTGENHFRPAHIHFRISGTDHQDLITQIYFKGDPHIAEDSSSSSPLSINRILGVTENAGKEKAVQFDIVMREEYPLDIAVFNKVCGL
jgi:catechol 1,2-dioxygenase